MRIPNPFAKLWRPEPVPPAFANGEAIPEQRASPISRLLFHWLTPILWVGYTRPLETEDLWSLPERRQAHSMADRLGEAFYSRCPEEKRPPSWRTSTTSAYASSKEKDVNLEAQQPISEKSGQRASGDSGNNDDKRQSKSPPTPEDSATIARSTSTSGKRESFWSRISFTLTHKKPKAASKNPPPPLNFGRIFFGSLYSTLRWRWWLAGLLQLIGDTLLTTAPLINKALLQWLTESYIYHRAGAASGLQPPRGIGYGVGLAFALFAMQEISSMATNQYYLVTMTNGMSIRAGVIALIFRKSLRLSGRARLKHSTGQITTLISTDATRLDLASAYVHNLWINPIQIIIGVGLLIGNLGYSALVGLGVLVIGFPLQALLVSVMFGQRKKTVDLTDQRMRIATEVLQGIRLLKLYAWEAYYAEKISVLRGKEVRAIRIGALARAGLLSLVAAVPIAASVLSFITYALTGHPLTPAIIFSSLQFLNMIRTPLIFFPLVLSTCVESYISLGRIGAFLTADELENPYAVDPEAKFAVRVDGDFEWEPALAEKEQKKDNAGSKKKQAKDARGEKNAKVLPTSAQDATKDAENTEVVPEKPFELRDMKIKVPKGAFVAVVGRVGSGKSSLLQAMIGEMRKTRGEVVFGGDVAYVPQTAWIMNATLKDNILFGREEDEVKFQEIVKACSLNHDLEMLPHGDMTEIGEKGINLSGGQKARVSLARAAYAQSDIILLDDPLSAVDAHVGKDILEQCLLQGPLADKARILVTHALNVLPYADYVYVMDDGVIVEEGTYKELLETGKIFAHLIEEFGSQEKAEDQILNNEAKLIEPGAKLKPSEDDPMALMQKEERNTGQIETAVYVKYLNAAGGVAWVPILLLLLTLTQASQVGNNLFLGFWTSQSIPGFHQGQYMAVYAALGVSQGLFSFMSSFAFSLMSLRAGLQLFMAALQGVIRSPISFYDTTPMGRILSRMSKDQDVMDNQLANMLYQLLSTVSSVFGTVALVFYTFPLLGILFAPMFILYWACATFYRRSSVEAKRLDSILRSGLYASYSETLTGLSTVRAYREQQRFITNSEKAVDVENRAYYMTIAIQRWLSVRLDILGNLLILGIALFAVGFRTSVDPSKIGVVLSYTLMITQVLSQTVTMFAQTEQNMNAVERVLVYSELPPEGDITTNNDPPPSWPSQGAITFQNVGLSYREGLPLVLKDVSFDIKAGEKIGIVGRTGAGKSSLLQALFRMVEVKQGSIIIDDVDCRPIGLEVLRRRLAVIPQDSVLFFGTLRDNLDPQHSKTDAELIVALRRAWLLPQVGTIDPVAEAKFSLDSAVGDEGSNFSAGERQLLALCRALVKNSKVIVLDEATSNVDVETDSKLQKTIQTEFSTSTLLCIAHRLNTIVYYDRILVMDAGRVAEFDSPLALFDRSDSIFRSLCDEANLSRQDIVRIRGEAQ